MTFLGSIMAMFPTAERQAMTLDDVIGSDLDEFPLEQTRRGWQAPKLMEDWDDDIWMPVLPGSQGLQALAGLPAVCENPVHDWAEAA